MKISSVTDKGGLPVVEPITVFISLSSVEWFAHQDSECSSGTESDLGCSDKTEVRQPPR
jgi:hypothetical protein